MPLKLKEYISERNKNIYFLLNLSIQILNQHRKLHILAHPIENSSIKNSTLKYLQLHIKQTTKMSIGAQNYTFLTFQTS
jgi:hypothetical protein